MWDDDDLVDQCARLALWMRHDTLHECFVHLCRAFRGRKLTSGVLVMAAAVLQMRVGALVVVEVASHTCRGEGSVLRCI